MSVTITIQKTVILNHLISEISAVYGEVDFISPSTIVVPNTNDISGVNAIYNSHTGLPYPYELRKLSAKLNAGKVSELKGISISQAKTWIARKLHGSDTETALDATIDAAVTVADLRPILKNVIATSYKRTETDKIILALLISIADQVMPDR